MITAENTGRIGQQTMKHMMVVLSGEYILYLYLLLGSKVLLTCGIVPIKQRHY